MKFKHCYRLLKAYGFSPFKAAEIILDARRGDHYARQFIWLARNAAKPRTRTFVTKAGSVVIQRDLTVEV